MAAAAKLLRQSGRRDAGRFLAEGPNLVAAALEHGFAVEVFATADAARRHSDLLAGVPVIPVVDSAARALSETVSPPGLVAVCRVPDNDLSAILARRPALLAVAVEFAEPGNAGTLIRTAHAMGAAAVIFAGQGVDPFNGKCVRSSAGSIFAVPVVTEPDPVELLGRLRSAGLSTLAATVDGDLSLDDADAHLRRPTGWVFGPEAHGLPATVSALADHRVVIPMPGATESLNVAAAAAICLYQSARAQRNS